jgi:NADH-quinone oxidoreductase subunit M
MNLFPQGFQMWSKWIAVLAVIGIVYAAAVALRQRDLKFVIGYSSVSHMGFVLLGFATANALGVSGAVLQMFSHGVIAALLFAVAGRMIYRRTHTRELDALSGMNLSRAMPFAAFTFVIAAAASMGIPGFRDSLPKSRFLLVHGKLTDCGLDRRSWDSSRRCVHIARAKAFVLR